MSELWQANKLKTKLFAKALDLNKWLASSEDNVFVIDIKFDSSSDNDGIYDRYLVIYTIQ
jgi:hypothetical protein